MSLVQPSSMFFSCAGLIPKPTSPDFYALMIENDLFGRVVLVRRWGRIGTRERSDPHENEAAAAEVMAKLAAAKRQRGYRDL